MFPVLFEIGSLRFYSFGLMLALAFLVGNFVLKEELRRRKVTGKRRDGKSLGADEIAGTITMIALIAGLAGAKLLSVIEDWEYFVRDPSILWSPGGLTWYGGFVLAIAVVIIYLRRIGVPVLRFLDALGLALMLAYGVGRVGCHLAGDGDYGIPTTLPWGTIYAEGTAKPARMTAEYFARNPAARAAWHYDSLRAIPAGVDRLGNSYSKFDESTPMHPTPIYELLLALAGFAALRILGGKGWPDGRLFAVYLLLASTFRFGVEFFRLQPRLLAGLSEAQLFAVALFATGLWLWQRTGAAAR